MQLTFMKHNISAEIDTLEKKLKQLRMEEEKTLRKELGDARNRVTALKAKIAKITGKSARPTGKRTRTSPGEMKERITEATGKTALTQKEISDKTSLPYGSV